MAFPMIDAYFSGVKDRKTHTEHGAPSQMRKSDAQLFFVPAGIAHPHAAELAKISEILDSNPRIAELVTQDLLRGLSNPETGARSDGRSGSADPAGEAE
jgi:hypothetical protein